VFAAAGFFFSDIMKQRNEYNRLKNGVEVTASLVPLDDHNPGLQAGNKWRYTFNITVDGMTKQYVGTTLGRYYAHIGSVEATEGNKISIKYIKDNDGFPTAVLVNKKDKDGIELKEKEPMVVKINGQDYIVAVARETAYFAYRSSPSLTAPILVFVIGGVLLGYALYILITILLDKSVEKNGILTYAIIQDASASKLGSRNYLSIRYIYKRSQSNLGGSVFEDKRDSAETGDVPESQQPATENLSGGQSADEDWIEAKSPFAVFPHVVDRLKSLDAIKIKYKGKRSVIVENLKLL
jgi:hypothetical protein